MKHIILIFSFLALGNLAFGQLKQKMADGYFEQMEYAKCVDMYDELAKKAQKGKGDWENVTKAAICHFNLFEMKKSEKYLKLLKSNGKLSEKETELLIEALRFQEKYDEAKKEVGIATNTYPKNPFFKRLVANQGKFDALFKDTALYTIQKTGTKTIYGDFAPTYFEDGLVYATKSKNTEVINGKYGWDDDFYISLLYAPIGENGTVEKGKLLKKQFKNKAHDGPVNFSADEQQMVITKNTIGRKKGKEIIVLGLYFAEKVDGKWSDLKAFPHNSTSYNVGHGCFLDNGKTLYFASDMPNGKGGTDIYKSEFKNGDWTKPVNLGDKINTEQNELFPYAVNNKLFFASNGHYGLGGLDVFEASLSNSTVRNLGYPVNTSHDDFGLIADSTGLNGYFSSNRTDNVDVIYQFEKEEIKLDLIVSVFEKYSTPEILPNHPVYVENIQTGEVENYFTDDDGVLHLRVGLNEEYQFSSEKETFNLEEEKELSTVGITEEKSFKVDLFLLPTKITVALRVIAEDTKKPIEGAVANVKHQTKEYDTTMTTNEHGLVTLVVDRNEVYNAHASKKGYIDDQTSFGTSNQDGKIIELELALKPIKKGEKFKLENIFYDLNKSSLRPESKESLDKLAKFILDNNLTIELSAHTDARGSKWYNKKLSQARAQSCVDYLRSKGVKKWQMKAKGYGESQLVNRCKDGVKCSEEEHQANRRTQVQILEVN